MATDPTILQDAAQSILDILTDSALDLGWEPRGCVTFDQPSFDCDSIHVWVSGITPRRDHQARGCHIVLGVTFSYGIATCAAAQRVENCEFWEAHTPGVSDKVWALEVGLVEAALAGTLCGVQCGSIRFNPLLPQTPNADVPVWIGSVEVDLSPVELAS